jgi:hypothetical protein
MLEYEIDPLIGRDTTMSDVERVGPTPASAAGVEMRAGVVATRMAI